MAEDQAHIGRGGRCGSRQGDDSKPDWSIISPGKLLEGSNRFYEYLIPGDTKLFKKWAMDGVRGSASKTTVTEEEWRWPLRQIQYYAKMLRTRYGFLITEKELVVFRFSLEQTGKGLSGNRVPRQTSTPGGAGHARSESELSEGTSSQSTDPDISTYDDKKPDIDLCLPEYELIPWAASGQGQLTVRLALFFLCMLAGEAGGFRIGYDYKPLHS
ncbi:hypothetical protein N658DRAFT_523557 [Parathielavia hyrcaniae]|uniref:Uncharacterized protein n=1 Tax=Parathielavia hyrcaniae TaxID=113614 RepID=A0AAN6Q311_9PEZI|nr:hypothetical protein N658DRAFT_523557 [Parathielavia hyrcaniae]